MSADSRAARNAAACAFPMAGTGGGLTKREYFAGLAMQGILANAYFAGEVAQGQVNGTVANAALIHADAILAELAK